MKVYEAGRRDDLLNVPQQPGARPGMTSSGQSPATKWGRQHKDQLRDIRAVIVQLWLREALGWPITKPGSVSQITLSDIADMFGNEH